MTSSKIPSAIKLHRKSKRLELSFDKKSYQLSFEYLRVHSPSAEVKGHGPGQEVLQFAKQNVSIDAIAQVGNYAIKLTFDDGHDSGIYSFDYLCELCENQDSYWQEYLVKLDAAGKSRHPDVSVVKII